MRSTVESIEIWRDEDLRDAVVHELQANKRTVHSNTVITASASSIQSI